ncbi:fasciclin domain-containing protein, partial [Streptomyces sp. NPDC002516]
MNTRMRRTSGLLAAAAVLPLVMTACSSGSASGTSGSASTTAAAATKSADMGGSSASASGMDQPFGPGCASV